jgi:DNA-binding NtrC family response regulator
MTPFSVFIVDDEQTIREGLTLELQAEYHVEAFPTAEKAIEAMGQNPPDLVLLDIGLPGMNGVAALERIKALNPDTLVIMITAYEDIKTVVSTMKLGAYDYVVKPIHMDGLELTIRNALETIRLRKEVQALQETYLKENLPYFIGESNAIQDVMEFIGMVANSPDTPILILGETGTGKELIASAIHYRSPNFKGPLTTVNCAAIPRDLIESELFGYEKGAFTGAHSSGKEGLIKEAEGGTLFLDEVGDLSLEAQAKLLRFLEEGEFYRVGGTKKLRIRTRVVSATNKNVDLMIEQGLFRKDLYFRLGVIKVQIPSLNERPEDIIPLAKHFLYEFSNKFGKSFTGITPEAESALMSYRWTGNIRELRNLIERAVLTGEGPELKPRDLGIEAIKEGETLKRKTDHIELPPISPAGIDISSVQESLERFYFKEALKIARGNESKAARLLSLNHHTFRYRKKKLNIE